MHNEYGRVFFLEKIHTTGVDRLTEIAEQMGSRRRGLPWTCTRLTPLFIQFQLQQNASSQYTHATHFPLHKIKIYLYFTFINSKLKLNFQRHLNKKSTTHFHSFQLNFLYQNKLFCKITLVFTSRLYWQVCIYYYSKFISYVFY